MSRDTEEVQCTLLLRPWVLPSWRRTSASCGFLPQAQLLPQLLSAMLMDTWAPHDGGVTVYS